MQRNSYTSVQPRSVQYRTNGSGRDTYIATNNGGHFKINTTVSNRTPTSLFTSKLSTPVLPIPKSIRYRTDGSGRDTYIAVSDGGFHPAALPNTSRDHFICNLRSYSRPRMDTNSSRDFPQSLSASVSKRSLSNLKERSRLVKECVQRLNKPTIRPKIRSRTQPRQRRDDISYT